MIKHKTRKMVSLAPGHTASSRRVRTRTCGFWDGVSPRSLMRVHHLSSLRIPGWHVAFWANAHFTRVILHMPHACNPIAYPFLVFPLLEEGLVKVKVSHSCLTPCNPMDYSLPGFCIHGILQGRILEWVAIPFSRESSQPRDQTGGSHIADGRKG